MCRPDHDSQQMRHHDADEANDSRNRYRRAGRSGDDDDGYQFQSLHGDTGVKGFPSPSTRRSRPRDMNGAAAAVTTRNGAIAAALSQVAPAIEPSSQKVTSRNCRSSATNTKRPIPALASAAMARPPSRKIAIDVRRSKVDKR